MIINRENSRNKKRPCITEYQKGNNIDCWPEYNKVAIWSTRGQEVVVSLSEFRKDIINFLQVKPWKTITSMRALAKARTFFTLTINHLIIIKLVNILASGAGSF